MYQILRRCRSPTKRGAGLGFQVPEQGPSGLVVVGLGLCRQKKQLSATSGDLPPGQLGQGQVPTNAGEGGGLGVGQEGAELGGRGFVTGEGQLDRRGDQ